MPSNQLPVVNFSVLNIDEVKPSEVSRLKENGSLAPLAKELVNCLKEFGFCYLKHPGLSETKVNNNFDLLREVFELPEEKKKVYARREDIERGQHGYTNRSLERPKEVTSVERYETFFTCPDKAFCWPDEVPNFKPAALEVHGDFEELAWRVFDLLGIGLELEDPSYFRRCHGANLAKMRQTLYHRYPDNFEPKPGQLRFHEHWDVGTITLLYQDNAGGLQVKTKSGGWMDVVAMPDTVVVLIAQMFQRWTSDKIQAPLHRVVIPADKEARSKDRCSISFFPYPAGDFVIEPLDGSDRYPPTTLDHSMNAYLAGKNIELEGAVVHRT